MARFVFLRLLGVIYFIAFASLWVQIEGLIGSLGILSLAPFLDALRDRLPACGSGFTIRDSAS